MIQLPIIEEPWIQTYQIRNFELGVLQDKVPWIYGKYINCCCKKKSFTHCIGAHGRFFTKENAMLMQKFKFDKSIFEEGLVNFIEFAKDILNHQWYLMGDFDEYYIKDKEAYNRYHFRHWAFIYGYNEIEKIFYSIGYTKGGKYRKYSMSYDEFLKAINVTFSNEKELYVKKNIDRIEFYAVKINPDYRFDFNLCDVYIGIRDYLHSTDSYENDMEKKYGIECEKKYAEYILNFNDTSGEVDIRFSRLFMELKNIMVRRLKYLVDIGIVSSDLLYRYEAISKNQETVHMLCIKYNITHDSILLSKIANIIKDIINMEQDVLSQINNQIYKTLKNNWEARYC